MNVRVLVCLVFLFFSSPGVSQIAVSLEWAGTPIFETPGWTLAGQDLSEFTRAYSYRWGIDREGAEPGVDGVLKADSMTLVVPLGKNVPLSMYSVTQDPVYSGQIKVFGEDPAPGSTAIIEVYLISIDSATLKSARSFAGEGGADDFSQALSLLINRARVHHLPSDTEVEISPGFF